MSLEEALSLEKQRLEKLWDAFELQEKDLNAALDQIKILEAEIASLREQGPAINKLETPETRGRQTTIVTTDPVADIMDSKSEGGPYSRVEQLEKLIERRNVGEVTSEEFEEMKKEILERKPQVSKDPVEIAQEEISGKYDSLWSGLLHGDDVPKKKESKDSAVSKSNVDSGGSSKMQELKELKEMRDSGDISDDEYEKMKREIIG